MGGCDFAAAPSGRRRRQFEMPQALYGGAGGAGGGAPAFYPGTDQQRWCVVVTSECEWEPPLDKRQGVERAGRVRAPCTPKSRWGNNLQHTTNNTQAVRPADTQPDRRLGAPQGIRQTMSRRFSARPAGSFLWPPFSPESQSCSLPSSGAALMESLMTVLRIIPPVKASSCASWRLSCLPKT